MKGIIADARREARVKSPIASPLRAVEKIGISSSPTKVAFPTERDVTTPTSSSHSVEKNLGFSISRKLSSEAVVASPTKTALKISDDRCSSPAKLTERKPSLITLNKVDNKEVDIVRTTLNTTVQRTLSPSRREKDADISLTRDLRRIILTPQVSPLKLAVKTKSSSTLGLQPASTCHSPNNKPSPRRRREQALDDIMESAPERSLSYRYPSTETEGREFEWDHLSKSFVLSPQK